MLCTVLTLEGGRERVGRDVLVDLGEGPLPGLVGGAHAEAVAAVLGELVHLVGEPGAVVDGLEPGEEEGEGMTEISIEKCVLVLQNVKYLKTIKKKKQLTVPWRSPSPA